jgi:hypothetical protein
MSNIRVEETIFSEVKQEIFESPPSDFDYVEIILISLIVVSCFRSLSHYLYNKQETKVK